MMERGEVILTVEETAKYLRISRATAYAGVKSGTIPAIRIGNRWLVPRIQLEKMLTGERQPVIVA